MIEKISRPINVDWTKLATLRFLQLIFILSLLWQRALAEVCFFLLQNTSPPTWENMSTSCRLWRNWTWPFLRPWIKLKRQGMAACSSPPPPFPTVPPLSHAPHFTSLCNCYVRNSRFVLDISSKTSSFTFCSTELVFTSLHCGLFHSDGLFTSVCW